MQNNLNTLNVLLNFSDEKKDNFFPKGNDSYIVLRTALPPPPLKTPEQNDEQELSRIQCVLFCHARPLS